ncbi:hypothetical protein SPI_03051 [Niveomyces insectorum RCEF 264]|uniref:Uncharacterized protein n=1 Tax=Niveomyces insectorum RCEF 264 TaxID=1081102 RepID=A0A167X122_9HYPO|nr:hypothetical protein SPI_03051 [Niveomyces insectorum RCEF 264]
MSVNRQAWDATAHLDLLVAVWDTLQPTGEQIRHILERTSEMGYSYTNRALTQHLQKLRRTATDAGTSAPGTPKTPKTPRTPRTPKVKGTPSKNSKRKSVKEEIDDGDDAAYSPSKKVKQETEMFGSEDHSVKKTGVTSENEEEEFTFEI